MTTVEELRRKVKEANDAYWIDNNPIMTDTEYDRCVENLRKLSPNDPILDELGSEEIGDNKVTHSKPMLSLAKYYDWKEIVSWCASVARTDDEIFMVSPKYDGISILLSNSQISTRGKNGVVGNDITHLAGHIRLITDIDVDDNRVIEAGVGLADYLEHDDDCYTYSGTRGELLISNGHFHRLQHNYPELFKDYKTCRNRAAGFANSKWDSDINNLCCSGHPIHIADFVSHRAYEIPVTLRELKEGRNMIAEIMQFINRPQIDYPVDGIVIRLADDQYGESLGVTAHHPRSAMAYKFTSETVDVVLKDVEWGVGEEHISPVAIFDPVALDGVMVERATLHNPMWMEDNLIMIGSILTIERRGGVIPKVIGVSNAPNVPYISIVPTKCPSCGGPVKRSGKFICCTNELCPGKISNKIIRGLNVLGIKGVGPALAESIIKDHDIKNIMEFADKFGSPDIQTLATEFTKSQVTSLIKLSNVMKAGVTAEQLLASVCIPKCSTEFVSTVERKCGGIMNLVQTTPVDRMYDEICNKCKSDAVTNFMIWMENNREKFLEYVKLFKIESPVEQPKGSDTVCFTESGPKPRSEMLRIAIANGYSTTENVNNCTILVCNDPNGKTSKLKRARAKGIRILSYEDFLINMNH
jgi:DNA ligase (NAD+)